MAKNRSNALLLLSFTLLITGVVGCKSRAEKDADKAVATAKAQADFSQAYQLQAETGKAQVAREDLNHRVDFFKAISGDFDGAYQAEQTSYKGRVHIRITPSFPVLKGKKRADTESEIVTQTESITVFVEVQERTLDGAVLSSCRVAGLKPEFTEGTLRFTCQGEAAAASRGYVLSLDYLDQEQDNGGSSVSARSESVSDGLLKRTIGVVNYMNVEISSPFGVSMKGNLKRQIK